DRRVTRSALPSDAAGLVSPHRELDAVTRTELAHEAGHVGLDGAGTDVEVGSDLAVGPSLRDRAEHLVLAGGERLHRLPGRPAPRGGEGGEQADGDAGDDQSLTISSGVDRLRQQRGAG